MTLVRTIGAVAFIIATTSAAEAVPVAAQLFDATNLASDAVGIDVALSLNPNDAWWQTDLNAKVGIPGARFSYSMNDAEPVFTNPDFDNSAAPQHLLATFVSLPRPEFDLDRFRSGAVPIVSGGFPDPFPIAIDTHFSVEFLGTPPQPSGYIMRLVILGLDPGFVSLTAVRPAGSSFCSIEGDVITQQLGTVTFDWYLIPEPSSLILLASGLLVRTHR